MQRADYPPSLGQMVDARPPTQATFEPDGLQPDERGNKSSSEPMHAELCIHCQAVGFNERDHSDTWNSHGYRLVWDDNGALQFEIDEDRFFMFNPLHDRKRDIFLRIHHERKDSIPNLPSITATAEAGCHFCKMLSNKIIKHITTHYSTTSTETPISMKFHYRCDRFPFSIRSLVISIDVDTEPEKGWGEFFLVEADPDRPCAQVLGIKANLSNWSFGEKTAVMRNWIGDCESSCHPERLGRTLPTRLLDLSSSEGPNQDVRLIYSKDISRPVDCKYAALSHCWGSPDRPPLKTQTNSLDRMLHKIPFQSLPANYRDAVRVTRGLGIDYLWIDSLCILQDSRKDWEAEASRMIGVYQQAHVTIVAATGNSCHDGFLDPKVGRRVQIPYASSLADSPVKDTYYLRDEDDPLQEIQDSPWNQRGWTLQESAFSTRRLFFTQNSFSYARESLLYIMDGSTYSSWKIKTAKSSMVEVKESNHSDWLSLVQTYSRRHFTFHQDQLPAISAWAQLMSQTINDRYLAGIWEGDLLNGLLWWCREIPSTQTLEERLKFTRNGNFLAPSWSWASQTQGILYSWMPTDQTKRYEILEIDVSPIGANPFGRIKDGHMVVSGAVRSLPMAPIQRCADSFQSTVNDGYCIQYYMDWWEERLDVTSGQTIERGIVQDVKMLLLAHCWDLKEEIDIVDCACGLLLLSTGTDKEYWRVGMFSMRHELSHKGITPSGFFSERQTIKIV